MSGFYIDLIKRMKVQSGAPKGYTAIPGSRVGGFRKPKAGGGFDYWYPKLGQSTIEDAKAFGDETSDATVKRMAQDALRVLKNPEDVAKRVWGGMKYTAHEFPEALGALKALGRGQTPTKHQSLALVSVVSMIGTGTLVGAKYGAVAGGAAAAAKFAYHTAAEALHSHVNTAYTGAAALAFAGKIATYGKYLALGMENKSEEPVDVDEEEAMDFISTIVRGMRHELQKMAKGNTELFDETVEEDVEEKTEKGGFFSQFASAWMAKAKGGPYIGPRGGKWADPQHTIAYKEEEASSGKGERLKVEGGERLSQEVRERLAEYKLDIVGDDKEQAVEIARKLEEGFKSPDLCKESPPVCHGNMGIPRDDMPQILDESIASLLEPDKEGRPKEDRWKAEAAIAAGADPRETRTALDMLLDHVKGMGAKVTPGKKSVGELKATQREIKSSKTFGMADAKLKGDFDPAEKPIVVTSDGHILDGHHRWAAMTAIGEDRKMNVIEVDMPMADLLAESFNVKGAGVFRADIDDKVVEGPVPDYADYKKKADEALDKARERVAKGLEPWSHMDMLKAYVGEMDKGGDYSRRMKKAEEEEEEEAMEMAEGEEAPKKDEEDMEMDKGGDYSMMKAEDEDDLDEDEDEDEMLESEREAMEMEKGEDEEDMEMDKGGDYSMKKAEDEDDLDEDEDEEDEMLESEREAMEMEKALSFFDTLMKARKGEKKAGAKYISRKPDGKGGFTYKYRDEGGKKGKAEKKDAPASEGFREISESEFDNNWEQEKPPSGDMYWSRRELKEANLLDSGRVWSVTIGDEGGTASPGFSTVNNAGYIVTTKPHNDANVVAVLYSEDDFDEGEAPAAEEAPKSGDKYRNKYGTWEVDADTGIDGMVNLNREDGRGSIVVPVSDLSRFYEKVGEAPAAEEPKKSVFPAGGGEVDPGRFADADFTGAEISYVGDSNIYFTAPREGGDKEYYVKDAENQVIEAMGEQFKAYHEKEAAKYPEGSSERQYHMDEAARVGGGDATEEAPKRRGGGGKKEKSKAEMVQEYREAIQNSKSMTPKEKEAALKRATAPGFDPAAALASMAEDEEDDTGMTKGFNYIWRSYRT